MSNLELLRKIETILGLFQYARLKHRERKALHVTEVARALVSPRSHGRREGAKIGREAHSKIWALDPFIVLQEEYVSIPFPLAYEIDVGKKKYIIYGVPDLIKFVRSTPVEVYEFKTYLEKDKYSILQTQIYAWLTWKCFDSYPKAYLILGWNGRSCKKKIKVEWNLKEIEEEIKRAVMKILRESVSNVNK